MQCADGRVMPNAHSIAFVNTKQAQIPIPIILELFSNERLNLFIVKDCISYLEKNGFD